MACVKCLKGGHQKRTKDAVGVLRHPGLSQGRLGLEIEVMTALTGDQSEAEIPRRSSRRSRAFLTGTTRNRRQRVIRSGILKSILVLEGTDE